MNHFYASLLVSFSGILWGIPIKTNKKIRIEVISKSRTESRASSTRKYSWVEIARRSEIARRCEITGRPKKWRAVSRSRCGIICSLYIMYI